MASVTQVRTSRITHRQLWLVQNNLQQASPGTSVTLTGIIASWAQAACDELGIDPKEYSDDDLSM